MRRVVALLCAASISISLFGCANKALDEATAAVENYNAQAASYNEAITPYNDAVDSIEAAAEEVSKAKEAAQEAINQGDEPFDAATLQALKEAMLAADDAIVERPKQLAPAPDMTVRDNLDKEDLERLAEEADRNTEQLDLSAIPPVPTIPDYSQVIESIKGALGAYEDSVKSMQQVTAPGDDFVIDRLGRVDTITSIQAVTEDHDPNGQLNKQGGYIGCIYFRDSQVSPDDLFIEEGEDTVDIGTDGGGAIEVFKTADEANVRNDYLASFDGMGMLASGSHYVAGTVLVRTSDELNGTQQLELTDKIIEALTAVN